MSMDGTQDPELECQTIMRFLEKELMTSGGHGQAARQRTEFFENLPSIMDDIFGEDTKTGWLETLSWPSSSSSSSSSGSSRRREPSARDRPFVVRLLSALQEEEGSLFKTIAYRVKQGDVELFWKVGNLPPFSQIEVVDACQLQRNQQPPLLYEKLFRPLRSQRRNVEIDDGVMLSPAEYLLFCFFYHPVLAGKRPSQPQERSSRSPSRDGSSRSSTSSSSASAMVSSASTRSSSSSSARRRMGPTSYKTQKDRRSRSRTAHSGGFHHTSIEDLAYHNPYLHLLREYLDAFVPISSALTSPPALGRGSSGSRTRSRSRSGSFGSGGGGWGMQDGVPDSETFLLILCEFWLKQNFAEAFLDPEEDRRGGGGYGGQRRGGAGGGSPYGGGGGYGYDTGRGRGRDRDAYNGGRGARGRSPSGGGRGGGSRARDILDTFPWKVPCIANYLLGSERYVAPSRDLLAAIMVGVNHLLVSEAAHAQMGSQMGGLGMYGLGGHAADPGFQALDRGFLPIVQAPLYAFLGLALSKMEHRNGSAFDLVIDLWVSVMQPWLAQSRRDSSRSVDLLERAMEKHRVVGDWAIAGASESGTGRDDLYGVPSAGSLTVQAARATGGVRGERREGNEGEEGKADSGRKSHGEGDERNDGRGGGRKGSSDRSRRSLLEREKEKLKDLVGQGELPELFGPVWVTFVVRNYAFYGGLVCAFLGRIKDLSTLDGSATSRRSSSSSRSGSSRGSSSSRSGASDESQYSDLDRLVRVLDAFSDPVVYVLRQCDRALDAQPYAGKGGGRRGRQQQQQGEGDQIDKDAPNWLKTRCDDFGHDSELYETLQEVRLVVVCVCVCVCGE
jgi:hypothetical protein